MDTDLNAEIQIFQIFDGSFLVRNFCGAENAEKLESVTNVVTLVLHSQAMGKSDGFNIVYRQKQIDVGKYITFTRWVGIKESGRPKPGLRDSGRPRTDSGRPSG